MNEAVLWEILSDIQHYSRVEAHWVTANSMASTLIAKIDKMFGEGTWAATIDAFGPIDNN
jgi:hypothetical protein